MLSLKLLRSNIKLFKRFLWTVESRGDDLVLKEDDKEEIRYPHLWLRDNCQCSKCFHKTSNSRIIEIEHFDFESRPLQATIKNLHLDVSWSDAHESRYSLPWLLEHQFTPNSQSAWLQEWYKPTPRPWTAQQFHGILKRYQYQDILKKDDVLLKWLESLAIDGVAVVEGAGTEIGKLEKLSERIAFLKRTNYGETFSIRNKPGTSNVAYLAGALQLHTDLPYYNHKPGIILLHCIIQGQQWGGESELVDGLSVCEWLREHHPHHYWILSTVPVEWEDIVEENGQHYHSLYRAPVICEGVGGEIEVVNWSQPQRASHFSVPVDQATPWYRALQVLTKRMHSPDSKALYKMVPGEIFVFNNVRMFHGRSNYEGERYLEGAYMDWDHLYSKIRVLKKQLRPS